MSNFKERMAEQRDKQVLGGRVMRLVRKHVGDVEPLFVIPGMSNDQCLVALDDRCLIVKAGWKAGTTGGARISSFNYADITGIELNTGWVNGVLEVLTPSYQGTNNRDFWASGKNNSPLSVSNCLPITKGQLKTLAPRIDQLRQLVAAAKRPGHVATAPAAAPNVTDQLASLAQLHRDGALSDEEFAQAKAAVLG